MSWLGNYFKSKNYLTVLQASSHMVTPVRVTHTMILFGPKRNSLMVKVSDSVTPHSQ